MRDFSFLFFAICDWKSGEVASEWTISYRGLTKEFYFPIQVNCFPSPFTLAPLGVQEIFTGALFC